MEESSGSAISHGISEELKMMVEFRLSYVRLKIDCEKLHDENFSLKRMLKMAEDSEQKQAMVRNYLELIVIKQNKIIENFMDIKEENMKLKKEWDEINEKLQNSYKEMDTLREKTADEIKCAEEAREKELECYRQQYIQEEKLMKEEFKNEKLNLNNTIRELKQTIEVLNNEKDVLVAVTVREYEDQLQSLRDNLNGSEMQLKVMEERNDENINIYKKKLEDQEKHYITMLEKIKCSVPTVYQNCKKQQQLILTSGVSTVPSRTTSTTAYKAIHQKQSQYEQLPVVISASAATARTVRNIPSRSSSVQQSSVKAHSEFYEDDDKKSEIPTNSSYYKRLQLPPPGEFQLVREESLSENTVSGLPRDCDDDNNVENVHHIFPSNASGQNRNKLQRRFDISVCNFGASKNNTTHDTEPKEGKDIKDDDCNPVCNSCSHKKVKYPSSRKRKLFSAGNDLM